MRIWISGCARTGTTLMNRLFYAFDNVKVMDREVSVDELVGEPDDGKTVVGKRTVGSIFADGNTQEEMERQLLTIVREGVKVLVMKRNAADVLRKGRGKDVSPERLSTAMNDLYDYGTLRVSPTGEAPFIPIPVVARVQKYEALCQDPDGEQWDIATQFNLGVRHPFSDYPSFVPESNFQANPFKDLDHYGPRPISTDSITAAPGVVTGVTP